MYDTNTTTPSTPTVNNTKKRFLSSPQDIADLKKGRFLDSIMETAGNTSAVNSLSLSDTDLEKIALVLKSAFQDDILSLIKPVVDGVVQGLQSRLDLLSHENATLKQENEDLRLRVNSLENMIDDAEQYSRRNCLRLTGIPETEGESTDDIIIKLCKQVNADIKLSDIDRSHRVGKPGPSKSRPIIVKFATYRSRQTLYKTRAALKSTGFSGAYLNEDLTRKRSQIMYTARQLVKYKKLEGCWTADGIIMVKDLNHRTHRVVRHDELKVFE
ncbi:uncharacterized protein LOC127881623 [Dreissena polymorpha]|uniref:uncharacterized protein LOC127881623 n=1 Tax=Dreissena polymorpha TaxID=45954 RepID=UPI0022644522|nr:uncharacterized protein LOC127881623 [Dreissena polymorpha]